MRKCANPARIDAPEAAVSAALRLPPCRFRQSSAFQSRSGRILGGSTVSTASFSSKTAAKRSSTTTATRRSGRACFKISTAGVVRTQSPSERNRITATRAPLDRRSSTVCIRRTGYVDSPRVPLFFDFRVANQHDGNIILDRYNN